MKTALLITLFFFLSSDQITGESNNVYSLTVSVNELHNSQGVVQFTLYNMEGAFPDEHYKNFFKQFNAEILDHSATINFRDLPQGEYAINILHDEDEDGKIKKGWILPVEGIGFSNFNTINLLNRPSFRKAKFNLNADKAIEVKMIYM
jgi:uncharacterized protein (DUF2141 family)